MKIIGIVLANNFLDRFRYSFVGLIFLILSLNSVAAIYKWVDEKGLTHYSDTKYSRDTQNPVPADQQKIDDTMPVIHSMEKPDARLTEVLNASGDQRRQRRKEDTAGSHTTAERKPSHCASLGRQLRSVQAALRKGYREPRGNKLRERRRELEARIRGECG